MSSKHKLIVQLFGRPQILWKKQQLVVPQKLLALLALLVRAPNGQISRSEVIVKLWGTSDRQKADASFRQFLTRIKKIEHNLPAKIISASGGFLTYNKELLEIDLKDALRIDITAAVRSGDYTALKAFLSKTHEKLFDTDALQNEIFEDWVSNVRLYIAEKATEALVGLINSEYTIGLADGREQIALKLIEVDPSQELAYRVLIEYYCECGDRAKAHSIYRLCEETLLADYGVEPELSTRQLAASLGLTTGPTFSHRRSELPGNQGLAVPNSPPTADDGILRIGVPRIMLLPPKLLNTATAAAGIMEALLDDITAGLTRYRSISILSGHSGRIAAQSFNTDVMAIGECYGVQYLVKSSVHPSNEGDIATFLLLDCRTGTSLAALNAPMQDENLPDLFSKIGREIVRQFVNAIERSEVEFPSAAQNRTAYRYFLEGRRALWHSDLPDLRRARASFLKSLKESDRFAPAQAGMSRTLSMERLVRGLISTDLLIDSLEFAETSIRLDPLDGRGLRERGFCNLYLRRHDESLHSFAAAALVNPNDADLLADYADALAHAGSPDAAISNILRAKELNPDYPDYYDWIHASILYQLADYETAAYMLSSLARNPAVARLLTASTAMAGDMASAYRYARILQTNYPEFDLQRLFSVIPDKNIQDTKHLLEGLRRAGLR